MESDRHVRGKGKKEKIIPLKFGGKGLLKSVLKSAVGQGQEEVRQTNLVIALRGGMETYPWGKGGTEEGEGALWSLPSSGNNVGAARSKRDRQGRELKGSQGDRKPVHHEE